MKILVSNDLIHVYLASQPGRRNFARVYISGALGISKNGRKDVLIRLPLANVLHIFLEKIKKYIQVW